jgi:hypothetical protein
MTPENMCIAPSYLVRESGFSLPRQHQLWCTIIFGNYGEKQKVFCVLLLCFRIEVNDRL